MHVHPGRALTIVMLAALVLVAAATDASARAGFYVGWGLANQKPGGDLDGNTAPELEAGSGNAFRIGYGFSNDFGLEYWSVASTHDQVDSSGTANYGYSTLALRVSKAMGDSELFLRVGHTALLGGHSLKFAGASTKFTGDGPSFGAGLEYMFARLGIELSYTLHDVDLKHQKSDQELDVVASTVLLVFSFYFR
ncbi:MAG: outer membrane beta-barrel protein [Candidatus Lambdaproteobacteria bacterium]|nr:outer membrane beta-barrel protein [Candidatus Lambdaproteobacteria bacterium]